MFKCPNCNKMTMQWSSTDKVLQCYGSRCFQKIAVPRKVWEGLPSPNVELLAEAIKKFKRSRKR